jgi:hypothetical protein
MRVYIKEVAHVGGPAPSGIARSDSGTGQNSCRVGGKEAGVGGEDVSFASRRRATLAMKAA